MHPLSLQPLRFSHAPLRALLVALFVATAVAAAPATSALQLADTGGQAEPATVLAPVERVVVHPDGARVRRQVELPPGALVVRVPGLARNLDPASLRLGLSGGEVLGFEVLKTRGADPEAARREELQTRATALREDAAGLAGRAAEAQALARHWRALLEAPPDPRVLLEEPERFERWRQTLPAVRAELVALGDEGRALEQQQRALEIELREVESALASLGPREGPPISDVVVRLAWHTGSEDASGAGRLTIEYRVAAARWEPAYDLRVDPSSQGLELSHRARVYQQSGEDWRGVELELSTARTRERVAPPAPSPIWLRIGQALRSGSGPVVGSAARPSGEGLARHRALGYTGEDAEERAPSPFAEVRDDGINLRYRAAGSADLLSRPESTDVLIGRARVEGAIVRHALPARDARVFLRFEGHNTSPWTLLPGPAAVHLGGDYLGMVALPRTLVGAEWEIDLGADPSLTVERIQLDEQSREPGFFGSRRTREVAWRLRVKHAGAVEPGAQPIEVRVVEVLPRSGDERIEVRLEGVRPPLAENERAKRLREEVGALTWILPVPRGGEAEVEWRLRTTWPADRNLVQH